MSNLSQHPAAAPLRDRNSPEPSKLPNGAVLREAAPNAGWQPSPPSTSPLRISKRSPSPSPMLVSSSISKTLAPKLPGKIPARRNSSSYRHMHSNNLVSKSPFKTLIPSAPSSSTSASRPIQIPQRRVSGEKRPRPMSMYEPADNENERPYTTKRERKQSKGFRGLNELEPVTKSPFRRAQFLGNGADPVTEKPLPSVPKQQQAVHSGSPVRSSLVSKRLHGPRSTSISKRPRRKTVTFHEECDVVEFDVEEPFDDDDEQGPYTDSEGDYEDVDEEMGHTGEEHEPEHDHEYDHDAYEHTNHHPIDHEHGHMEMPTAAVRGNEDRGIQGPMTASPPLPEPPHTPPLDVAPVPDQETEDGVPYGRTHHAERARQFHQEQATEHFGTPPLPPPPPPQEPPRRRSIDALGPLPPIPTGDGVGMRTPPIAGSPSTGTSTPPLGRSTHAERARAEHAAHAFDEDVRQLPPSPSPHKPSPPVLSNGMGPRLSLDIDSAITSHDSHDAFEAAKDERELSFNSIRSHPSFNSLRSAASASGASSPHDAGSPSLDGVSISAFEAEIAHVVSGSARSSIDESYNNDNDIDDGDFANHQDLRHSTPPPPPPPPIPIPRSRSASPYGSRENSPVPGRFHSPRVSSPLAAPENNCTPPPPPRTAFSPHQQQQPSPTSGCTRITREDMQQRLIHQRSVEEALGASANVGNSTSSNLNLPSGFGSQGQMHSRVSSDSLISGPSNHSGLGHGRSSGIGSDKFVRTLSLDVSSSSLGLDGSFDATDADGDVSMGNINVSAEHATIEQVERRSMNAPLPPIPGGGIVAAITPGIVPFPAGGKARTGSNASLPALPVAYPQPRPALTSSASADRAVIGLGSVADIVPPIRPSIRPRAHTIPRTDADDSMSVAVGIGGSGGGGLGSPGGAGAGAGGMDVDMRSALDRLMDDVASVASGHADLEADQDPEREQQQEQQEREDEDEQEEEQQQHRQRHRRRRDRRRYSRGPGVEGEDEAEEEEDEEDEGQVGHERVRDASVSLMEVETTMTTDPETSLRVEVITDGIKAGHFDMLPTHVQRHEREDEEMMDDDRDEDKLDQRDSGEEGEQEEEEPESGLPYKRETEDSPEPAPAPVVDHEESSDEHAEEEHVQDPDDTMMTEDAEEEQEEEEDAPMKLDHRSLASERRGLHARAATDTELLMSKPQPPLPTTPSITIDFAPLDIGESISGTSFPAVGTSSSASFSRPSSPPAPAPPAKDAIKDRHQLIIEKRREARRREEAAMGLPPKRTGRRRSMSTGDAEGVRAKQASTARPDSPGLDVDGIDNGEALEESINRELQKLGVAKKKYQVRERRETIYASSDAAVGHLDPAGDVNSSKAWKAVKRPSDMNEYAKQIREFRAQEKPGKGHGKVFVKVVGVKLDLPLPPQPTIMTCTLNNGIHYVTTPECNLTSEAKINQEFELIEHSKLEFTLTLKVRRDPHIITQFKALQPPPAPQTLAPPPTRVVQAPPQRSGMRRFFSSSPKPKDPPKNAAPPPRQSAPPPVHRMPDNLARYLKQDGMLARAFIAFKDVASHCDTRLFETSYPLIGQRLEQGGGVKSMQVGEIILQMFRLPPLPGVPQHELPQSLEECHRGLRHVAWHKVTYFEGILTQNGGDCLTWRRRQLRVIGANLVAFNDVTKRATASIDIRKAIAIEDDQDRGRALSPISARSQALDDYDGIFGVERSFRLIFPHNQEIVFFADTDEEKSRWLEVLRALVGHIPPNPFWAELVWQKQHDLARQQQQQTPSMSL